MVLFISNKMKSKNYQRNGAKLFLMILLIFPPRIVDGIELKRNNESQEGVHSI